MGHVLSIVHEERLIAEHDRKWLRSKRVLGSQPRLRSTIRFGLVTKDGEAEVTIARLSVPT